jgi:hypothetical protein
MSAAAMDTAIVDLLTWRRDAERRIAQLESQLRGSAGHGLAATAERTDGGGRQAAAFAPTGQTASQAAPWGAGPPAWAPPAASRARPARQYDLDLKPGEIIDIPSALNAGHKKRLLGWLVAIVILGGLGALILSALASNR